MANPIVTGAKALINSIDDATKAAQGTADGFSDEALAKLPMDEASRMSRAGDQGFDVDTDWYHGTGDMSGLAEKGFDPKFLGSGADQWGAGYYLTNKPSTASGYANGDNAGVIPAKIKITNPLYIDSTQARSIDDVLELTPEQVRQMLDENPAMKRGIDDEDMNPLGDHYDSFWETGPEEWMLDDLAERYTNPNHLSNDLFDGDEQAFLNALSKATGHDGVIVNFPESSEKFAIAFQPENIRSKFARFNPEQSGSRSLLAGVGGGAVLLGVTPDEAKAAPLEAEQLQSATLDAEGVTTDQQYTSMLTEQEEAVAEARIQALAAEAADNSIAADIGEGIVEAPIQAIGGFADAINETLDMTKELGDWLNENVVDLGGVTWGEDGLSLAGGKDIEEAEGIQIPTTEKADSTTGGLIRGVSQFITGFVGAGKFKAIQALKPVSTAGKIGKASIQGAMADFAAFDPHEERLSNLVQEFPSLQNPVNEFLAASTEDNAAEGRFKNAVEGLGIGVAVDGLLTGLKILRNVRSTKKEVEMIAESSEGLGAKAGESFDPDIKVEEIQAAINGFEPKAKSIEDVDIGKSPIKPDNDDLSEFKMNIDDFTETKTGSKKKGIDIEVTNNKGDFVGVIQSQDMGGGVLQIHHASVADTGKGIGTKLYKKLIKEAKAKGFNKIVSDNSVSSPARAIWEKLGAVKTTTKTSLTKGSINKKQPSSRNEFTTDESPLYSIDIDSINLKSSDDLIKENVDISPEDLLNRPNIDVDEGNVFVNWSRIDSPDDVKALMRDMADKMKPEIDEARRGKQTFEQMKINAEGVDAWEVLSSRRKGQPLNAEQSVAARELWARSADNLSRVAKDAALNPTPANLMAFKKMTTVHNQVQREVIAARTETARALASWRIPSGPMKMDEVEQVLAMGGGSKGAQMMAQRIADLAEQGMIKEMDEFVEKSAWAKTGDAIKQAFYFSMLSGPKTHLRNVAGATSAIAQQIYERKGANLLGQALGREHVAAGEAMGMASSLLRGARETFITSSKGKRVLQQAKQLKQEGKIVEAEKMIEGAGSDIGTARKYIATGKSGWGTGKVDETMVGAFDPEVWNVQKESILGRGMSMINSITMTPTHVLGFMDEVFTTMAYRMEVNAQAIRNASNEVADGKMPPSMFDHRVQQLMDEPQAATKDNARQLAKQVTFTEQPKDTPVWNFFKKTGALPYGIGTIIMPFVRTPYNIGRYTFERTPLAPLVARWRDDLAAGGARADLALAKMGTGSMIMLAMADLAMSGQITGEGPSDYKQREQLKRTGWQPNSIKVTDEDGKDNYYSVRGMEPFSTPLMLASNMVEILKQSDIGEEDKAAEQAWMAAVMSVANQVTSQQYMSGVSGFFEMMADPKRYGASWSNRLAGAVIPTGVAEVTRSMDPYARVAYDMATTIRRRTPGLSKDLPLNTDVWGRPIDYRSDIGGLYDALSPVYVSNSDKAEPIDKELNRLEKYISKPPKKTNFNGIMIDLKRYPHAYTDIVRLSGNELTETNLGVPIDIGGKGLKDTLNDLVKGIHPLSFDYEMRTDGSDGGKAQMIQSIVTKFQRAARDKVLSEHPDLQTEYEIKKSKESQKYNIGL